MHGRLLHAKRVTSGEDVSLHVALGLLLPDLVEERRMPAPGQA